MGCVVVTEPFDLTVVGGRHPFTVANRMQSHIGSICEPRRGGHIRDLFVAKGILVGTHARIRGHRPSEKEKHGLR